MGEGCVFAGETEMILAIYCAGGLGKEVHNLAMYVNNCEHKWDKIIFVDDITEDKVYCGSPVYRFEEMKNYPHEFEFVIASGEPKARELLYKKIKSTGFKMGKLISCTAEILPGVTVGEGAIIYGATCLSADVTVEENVLIMGAVAVGHDAVIKAHSVVSFRVFIGGHTVVSECAFLGANALIKDRINIGVASIVSLGAVVLRSVKDRAIMVGNPAQKIGRNEEDSVFNRF